MACEAEVPVPAGTADNLSPDRGSPAPGACRLPPPHVRYATCGRRRGTAGHTFDLDGIWSARIYSRAMYRLKIKIWAGLLMVGIALSASACAGVTPSVEVGVLQTTSPTLQVELTSERLTTTANNWLIGASLKARFPQGAATTIEPCATLVYNVVVGTVTVSQSQREDRSTSTSTTSTTIPGEICVEIDSGVVEWGHE